MLPKRLHIEMIDQFHDRFEEVNKRIKELGGDDTESEVAPEHKQEMYSLLMEYMELTKLWSAIDDFLEFKVKHKLEVMRDEGI